MTTREQHEAPPIGPLSTSTHTIILPFPSLQVQTQLTAHLTLFNGPSVLLWCGECAEGWTVSSEQGRQKALAATPAPSSSLLLERDLPPHTSPRQELPPVTGRLASEWAVAMTNPRTKVSLCLYRSFVAHVSLFTHPCLFLKHTNSTSLYRSNADLAKPMSARLCESSLQVVFDTCSDFVSYIAAKRFSIAQLFLSLSLPHQIISALDGPYSGSEGGKALLFIEGALIDILKQTLTSL